MLTLCFIFTIMPLKGVKKNLIKNQGEKNAK